MKIHCLLLFLLLNTVLLSHDITIGVYSGTFDPPTLAHNHIIRSSITYLKLDKLYIFVNKNGEKSYKCSAKQRVEMLENMLKDIQDKIVVIDQFSDKKYHDYLMLKKCIHQPITGIVGYDSYVRRMSLPQEMRIEFDAIAIIPRFEAQSSALELESIAFMLPLNLNILHGTSSTEVRRKIAVNSYENIALHDSVLAYIIKHNLYQNNSDKAAQYEEAYYAYIGKKFVTISIPPFDPQASVEAWNENFYKWILHNKPQTTL